MFCTIYECFLSSFYKKTILITIFDTDKNSSVSAKDCVSYFKSQTSIKYWKKVYSYEFGFRLSWIFYCWYKFRNQVFMLNKINYRSQPFSARLNSKKKETKHSCDPLCKLLEVIFWHFNYNLKLKEICCNPWHFSRTLWIIRTPGWEPMILIGQCIVINIIVGPNLWHTVFLSLLLLLFNTFFLLTFSWSLKPFRVCQVFCPQSLTEGERYFFLRKGERNKTNR